MTNKKSFSIGHLVLDIEPLPGYKEPKPMVFLGLFPVDAAEYSAARQAMERLRLSDSAFTFRAISSLALGNGFHCGFLGLLHAEIVQERLLREFGLTMMATAPSVEYQVALKSHEGAEVGASFLRLRQASLQRDDLSIQEGRGAAQNAAPPRATSRRAAPLDHQYIAIQSAAEFPDPSIIEEVREPVMRVTVYAPSRYLGAIMQLCHEKRGDFVDLKYLQNTRNTQIVSVPEDQKIRHSDASEGLNVRFSESSEFSENVQVQIEYFIPLSEMIVDFFDRLKSVSEGYASLDYEINPEQRRRVDYQPVEVVKVDILVNHQKVDALSFLIVAEAAERRSRELVERLARVIPRQQFNIPIQAAIGGKVIARADVRPFRKDVTQKLYGGDRTRKDKLLEAQKKGKARLKTVGRVVIPQTAFFEVLRH